MVIQCVVLMWQFSIGNIDINPTWVRRKFWSMVLLAWRSKGGLIWSLIRNGKINLMSYERALLLQSNITQDQGIIIKLLKVFLQSYSVDNMYFHKRRFVPVSALYVVQLSVGSKCLVKHLCISTEHRPLVKHEWCYGCTHLYFFIQIKNKTKI